MAGRSRIGRGLALRGAAIAIGFLIAAGGIEIVLRFFPVATGTYAQPTNAENPVFRFQANRTYVWSIGWNFSVVNEGWSNNEGFINDQSYDASRTDPLLAIIGDSYVEALMVPYEKTLQGRLSLSVGSRGRVYSFAASGAPLSQYLVWAGYAHRRFHPDGMIFVVVGNDFDESLSRYKTGPGFHHFLEAPDGSLDLRLYDYSPRSLRKLIRRSALARYLVFNLHAEAELLGLVKRLKKTVNAGTLLNEENAKKDNDADTARFVGNTASSTHGRRVQDSLRAVNAFLESLPDFSGLPPERVAFVVDGVRPQIYEGPAGLNRVRDSYFSIMRREFMARARNRGYEVIDMNDAFMADYRERGLRFEFENDSHWSAEGHAVAAAMVRNSAVYKAIFHE
ncbi:MAG TPA: hypothetical protein VLS27_15365 [Gammaproteobacteria bacterium]|nr:hypothetical protein [Gammaproteobacteria bacterium]